MGRETERVSQQATSSDDNIVKTAKAWGTATIGFASSLLMLCDSAEAQQPSGNLPTIEVTPPPRTPKPAKPRRRAAPAQPVPATPTVAPTQTEATGPGTGYQAANSGISRIATPLINTPQTVNVVTQQVIREQNVTTMADALRNVPGITFRAGEGGNQGDSPIIRGYDAKNDIFRDGVRDPGWYTRDVFSVENVEVLKGPASFLFGRGSTGGVINLVTKTPKDHTFVEAEISGNTAGGGRATIDANNKINEAMSARIQVMGQMQDTPNRDHVEENRFGIAPSLSVKLTEQTKVMLSYIYQHDENIPDRGIPFLPASFGYPRQPAPVDRSTWYGVRSGNTPDFEQVDAHVLTGKIEHKFSEDVKLTNTTRYVDVDRLNRATLPQGSSPTPANINTYSWKPGRQYQTYANELIANTTDLSAKFWTGPLHHTFVAGADIYQEKRQQISRSYLNASAAAANYLNPDPDRAPGAFGAPGIPTESNATTVAGYIADQIKLNEYFEIMGGARFDNFRASSGAATVLTREDDIWSYRVGAIFHPIKDTSLYVMHGTSSNPSAELLTLQAANANLGPEKSETTEIGFKADLLNRQLSFTAAVFRTEKTNMRVPDPTNTALNILEGVSDVEGFELGLTGKLTDRWSIFAGYTHLRSGVSKTTQSTIYGKELIGTPNEAFSLWTTYAVTDALTIGGGAYYTSEVWGDVTNTALVPEFWRFDLMASYKFDPHTTLQLNIYNLTDEYYYTQAYSNWAVPGPGRYASLSLKYRW